MNKLLVAITGIVFGYLGFKVSFILTAFILGLLSLLILGMFLVRVKLAPQFVMDIGKKDDKEKEHNSVEEDDQVKEKSLEERQLEDRLEKQAVRDEQIKAQARKEVLDEIEKEKKEKADKEFLETHGISCHEHKLECEKHVEETIAGPSIFEKADQQFSDEFDKYHDEDAEAQQDIDEVDSDAVSELDDMLPPYDSEDDNEDDNEDDPTVLMEEEK